MIVEYFYITSIKIKNNIFCLVAFYIVLNTFTILKYNPFSLKLIIFLRFENAIMQASQVGPDMLLISFV